MARNPRMALVACLFAATPAASPAQTGDNVLIIVADDLGVDNVGVYAEGIGPPATPNLDGLAQRGVLFRNVWSYAVCSPTRACIHTGRYGLRTRVGHITATLPRAEFTIPEVLDLAGAGYAHAAIGKWHLGPIYQPSHPNVAGWSHFAGVVGGSVQDYYQWARTENGRTGISTTYATTQMVDDALTWIGQQSSPWVCYLAFCAVHTPFHAPPAHLHSQNLTGKNPGTEPVPFHAAMIEALDAELGRLFGALGPELARTNVIFVGDNGTNAQVSLPPFEPGHAKATPYEGGLNVPLLVAGPAVQAPGREVDALVATVDVFATVLELAGVDAAAVVPPRFALDAQSFAPYLRDPTQAALRQTVYAEQFLGTTWSAVNNNGFAAVRDIQHKLIRFPRAGSAPREELYDLQQDPFEQVDLLAGTLTPAQQQALAFLQAELDLLRSPRGGLYRYGSTSCVGSNGNPSIGGQGVPSVGSSYDITLANAAAGRLAFLLTGTSSSSWLAFALPFETALLNGGSGCNLYCSADWTWPVMTSAAGVASSTVVLPAAPDFVGVPIYHSWAIDDPAAPANSLGVTLSDAMTALIGT